MIAGGLVALAVVGVVLFLLLSGGDDDSGDSSSSAATDEVSSTSSTSDDGTPTVGTEIRLKTFETTILATVTDYREAAVGRFQNIPEGDQVVGVELSLENTGNQTYTDAPGNGARIRPTDGGGLKPFFPVEGDCPATGFSSTVSVPPGTTRSGCIAFTIPAGQEGSEFEYTPDSGFADDTGTWTLPPLG